MAQRLARPGAHCFSPRTRCVHPHARSRRGHRASACWFGCLKLIENRICGLSACAHSHESSQTTISKTTIKPNDRAAVWRGRIGILWVGVQMGWRADRHDQSRPNGSIGIAVDCSLSAWDEGQPVNCALPVKGGRVGMGSTHAIRYPMPAPTPPLKGGEAVSMRRGSYRPAASTACAGWPSALNPSWNVTLPRGMRPSNERAKNTSAGTPSMTSSAIFSNPNCL